MPASRYLTGDKAAISEFIDRFDVSASPFPAYASGTDHSRHFSSTVMVCLFAWHVRINCTDTFLPGVLWSGDHLFDHIPETIDMLRQKGTVFVPA